MDKNLDLRRRALRAQLQAQRHLLALELQPDQPNHDFPRSMIMRFFTHQSGAKVVAEVATVLLGARLLKSLTPILAAAKIFQAVASRRRSVEPR